MKWLYVPLLSGIFLIASCKKENDATKTFDSLAIDTYYPSEILDPPYTSVYGSWEVYGTSGGFTGLGYPKDFDKLLMKPNGIFGIVRNDSLLTHGKIVIKSQTAQNLYPKSKSRG